MKKILILLIILSNLTFGAQNFSANSKVLDKIEAEVTKELERGNNEKAISILKKSISENPEKSVFLKIVLGKGIEKLKKSSTKLWNCRKNIHFLMKMGKSRM